MEFGIKYSVDFNKICRICLSTKNLRPITELVDSDEAEIQEPDTDIFFCVSIDFVLSKYAHIKFETVDKLPKQICFCCYQQLSVAYSFFNNCKKMNTALMECLERHENSLNIPSNTCIQHFDNINLEIIQEEIKEEPEISIYSNLEDIKIDYEENIPVNETYECANVTNNSPSLEITKEPQKSTESSLKKIRQPQWSNPSNSKQFQNPLNEFQNDFEIEISTQSSWKELQKAQRLNFNKFQLYFEKKILNQSGLKKIQKPQRSNPSNLNGFQVDTKISSQSNLKEFQKPQLSILSRLKESQKPQKSNLEDSQKSNLNEFQIDFETEIPVITIPAPLEAVYLTEVPEVKIETPDENYNLSEGAEMGQERSDQINFDLNSVKFTVIPNPLERLMTEDVQLRKRCKICWKQFKLPYVCYKKEFKRLDPTIDYCECSNVRCINVKALYKKNMRLQKYFI